MTAHAILPTLGRLSARQPCVRQRARRASTEAAVRLAVDSWFGFTHRLPDKESLWSDEVTV